MSNSRVLKEAASTIEVVIAKSLSGQDLMPSELDEVRHITTADLMIQHELDSLMAEKVTTHIKREINREAAQSFQTWQTQSRQDIEGSYKRTNPYSVTQVHESAHEPENTILEDFNLEDITDMSVKQGHSHHDAGRMLDYGHVKSDSHEGRMMRQALHQISEYGSELHEMLSDDDDLPQWCHYKIAVARACVSKVKHYLEYKIAHPKQK